MQSRHSDVSDNNCRLVQEESSKTVFVDDDLPEFLEMRRNMAFDSYYAKIGSSEDYEGPCETSEREESRESMNEIASIACDNSMCQNQTCLKTITNSYGSRQAGSVANTIPEGMILGEKVENLNTKASLTFGEEIGSDKTKTALTFDEESDFLKAEANLAKANLMKENFMKAILTSDEEICSSKTVKISTLKKDLDGKRAKNILSLNGDFDSFETEETNSEEKVESSENPKLKKSCKEGSNLKENAFSHENSQVGKGNPSAVKEIACPVENKSKDTQSEVDRPIESRFFDFQYQLNSQEARTMTDESVAGSSAGLNTNRNSTEECDITTESNLEKLIENPKSWKDKERIELNSQVARTMMDVSVAGASAGLNTNSKSTEKYDITTENDFEELIENPKFGTDKEKMELKEKLSKMNVIFNDELKLIREQHERLKVKKTEQKSKDETSTQNKLGSLFGIRSMNPFSTIATKAIPQFYTTMFKDMLSTVSLRNIISPICGEENSDLEAIEEVDLEAEAKNLYLDPKKLDLSEFEDHATKKMKMDGGLWYTDGASRSILLKYEALPPSLSLQSRKDKTM